MRNNLLWMFRNIYEELQLLDELNNYGFGFIKEVNISEVWNEI
jgi:hypothetical protein